MRKTKIVCTIGPASESFEILKAMIEAGMDVARFNMSHGEQLIHAKRLKMVRQAAEASGKAIGILIDTKGPEIRIGTFANGSVELREGDNFIFTTEQVVGNNRRVYVEHPGFPRDAQVGGKLLLDDGNIEMVVEKIDGSEVQCRVINGGVLTDRKKINLPGQPVSLPALSDKDRADISFAVQEDIDFIAASFIRRAEDVLEIRRVIEEAGGYTKIIAKIENKQGVDNLDEILEVADGLMVARGDLGVEIPTEEVPIIQKIMIEKCNRLGKPVITATQMLESMVHNLIPTRAEASDVANAILDGTDAVMLSAETAVGKHPVETVAMMARIAERADRSLDHDHFLRRISLRAEPTVTDAISHATCTAAQELGASAIITATESGHTARMVAKYRPAAPIIAVTPNSRVQRSLTVVWGVEPLKTDPTGNTDVLIEQAIAAALDAGLIANGDLVVLTAGIPVGMPGTTNMLKVHTVADVLVKGIGIGKKTVTGRVCVVRNAEEAAAKCHPGDILVTIATDKEFVPVMEKIGGVVTEEGGLTSHAAVVGLSLGIPVVVGATRATELLRDDLIITLDGVRGVVYRGRVKVL